MIVNQQINKTDVIGYQSVTQENGKMFNVCLTYLAMVFGLVGGRRRWRQVRAAADEREGKRRGQQIKAAAAAAGSVAVGGTPRHPYPRKVAKIRPSMYMCGGEVYGVLLSPTQPNP